MDAEKRGRVRALNDLLRQQHTGGRIILTSGIVALGQIGGVCGGDKVGHWSGGVMRLRAA